jgi:hypothetical protein
VCEVWCDVNVNVDALLASVSLLKEEGKDVINVHLELDYAMLSWSERAGEFL